MPEPVAPTLSTVGAARLAGVSVRTFRRWVRKHPLPSEAVYGPHGVEHRYHFAGVDALVRKMRGQGVSIGAQVEAPTSSPEPAHDTADTAGTPDGDRGHDGTGRQLAFPASDQAAEVVELLRKLVEENRQLREVLSAVAARLPGPPAPPSPPPRLRWRVVAEVVLLGWVGLLAGVLGAVVLQRLADVGVVTLPAWWPIG